ncbi:conserved hypothetical protein [Rhodococcus jostii RHA1]|jgi:hypothetical protein|uniref:Bacterial Ig domain-containing protein n=1 Tax=Rhodococcus jostii (strain RHA1) TaxID=101510 RepID=Q0S0Y7_RHOJR|nr:conserved hypothetical protein [Rhodococcus jostii RHA1]
MRASRSRCLTTLLVVLALCTAVLAACAPASTPSTSTTKQPSAGPPITVVPADGATAVNPLDPVSVGTEGGTLESVTMTNDEGKVIDGIVTPDRLAWKPGAPLGYNRTYTLVVTAVGDEGARSERTSTFSTVRPGNQTKATFVTSGGNLLTDGGTFGVGIVAVTHFDEPITDRAAAERALSVETIPPVTGSWYWADDQNVHWRPQNYYAPGTRVTVHANVYGVPSARACSARRTRAPRSPSATPTSPSPTTTPRK